MSCSRTQQSAPATESLDPTTFVSQSNALSTMPLCHTVYAAQYAIYGHTYTPVVKLLSVSIKVRKKVKIRNSYNQVPQVTQDITSKSDKHTKTLHTREPRG